MFQNRGPKLQLFVKIKGQKSLFIKNRGSKEHIFIKFESQKSIFPKDRGQNFHFLNRRTKLQHFET